MAHLEKSTSHNASGQLFKMREQSQDRASLIKQIGRLRIQIHDIKFQGKPKEHAEILRMKISILKDQIESLRKESGH